MAGRLFRNQQARLIRDSGHSLAAARIRKVQALLDETRTFLYMAYRGSSSTSEARDARRRLSVIMRSEQTLGDLADELDSMREGVIAKR